MKITTINTIEVSSLCDNECEYCPAPIQGEHRQTGLMTIEVFKRAIGWVKILSRQGTQLELNLFGIGEPTLNPQLVEFVRYARLNLPASQVLHLNTNGNGMTLGLAWDLKSAGITAIDLTAHKARAAAKTIRLFKKAGIVGSVSLDFITMPNNWAGQVDWFAPEYYKMAVPENICPWLGRGQVMVMSNGDVTNCCIDAFASGVFATVYDDLMQVEVEEMPLCAKCHHLTPREYAIACNNQGRSRAINL